MLPVDKHIHSAEIFAAQKIIADISSGLYRSPAAALKELVSNAYDADATTVVVSTDAPNFRTLVVRDDGVGMTIKKFLSVMNHIGGSRKRIIGGDTTDRGRKIIGRIGIGMLAVAQLGYRFYVTSSVANQGTRFVAEVDLEPYHKDDAALVSMGKLQDDDQVQIGAVRYVDDIPEEIDAHYTVITIPNARKGLISEITSAVRDAVGAEEKLSVKECLIKDFFELVKITRQSKRADIDLDGYYYMLWELSQMCPVNYRPPGPFDSSERRILGNLDPLPMVDDFKVIVDGIQLFRPIHFPNKVAINYPSPDPIIYPLSFERDIAGRKLAFSGYIYAQQPHIDPEEVRGVAIRIRDVGIGKYDRTWLGYPFDEGIKFGQVTGEIFVFEGLESALNIDRDSFKETDVHFQALRAYIWDKLRKTVFAEFKTRQREYSRTAKGVVKAVQQDKFEQSLLLAPAPLLIEKLSFGNVEAPTISTWIKSDRDSLRMDRAKWNKFVAETELSSQDEKDRFVRVLQVLISNELLLDMTENEADLFLQAIARAIQ